MNIKILKMPYLKVFLIITCSYNTHGLYVKAVQILKVQILRFDST